MVSDLAAGAGALINAYNLAKGLSEIRDTTKLNSAIIDLQRQILAAQEAHAANIQQIGALEKEISCFKNWETERQRYELKETPTGFFSYHLKVKEAEVEPTHRICANCYEHSVKSILQTTFRSNDSEHLKCHACSSEFQLRWKPHESWDYSQPLNSNWAV